MHTKTFTHSMCNHEFNVKLAICSIHLCIHHHLDQNTEKDMMDRVVTTRLLHDALLVAYQPTMSSLPTVIFIQPMQTCVHHHHEAVGLHYSFVHSASLVFIYRQRYMDQTVSRLLLLLRVLLVAYQPTVSIIPRNNNIHHRMHANVCSECRG